MSTVVNQQIEDALIKIEVSSPHSEYEHTGALEEKVVQMTENAFRKSLETLVVLGRQFSLAKSRFGDDAPKEFEISFGIKFSAEGDIWIAKVSGESQITATITWKT